MKLRAFRQVVHDGFCRNLMALPAFFDSVAFRLFGFVALMEYSFRKTLADIAQ
jgi:hypothetical protein